MIDKDTNFVTVNPGQDGVLFDSDYIAYFWNGPNKTPTWMTGEVFMLMAAYKQERSEAFRTTVLWGNYMHERQLKKANQIEYIKNE